MLWNENVSPEKPVSRLSLSGEQVLDMRVKRYGAARAFEFNIIVNSGSRLLYDGSFNILGRNSSI